MKPRNSPDAVKIKMLSCMAGSNFVWNVGDVIVSPRLEAERLVKAGFAEFFTEAAKSESE